MKKEIDYTGYTQNDYIKANQVAPDEETKEWTIIDKDEMYIQYKVAKNDSLIRISFLSGMSEKQIKKLNNLTSSYLVEGQVLTLPKYVNVDKKKKTGFFGMFKKSSDRDRGKSTPAGPNSKDLHVQTPDGVKDHMSLAQILVQNQNTEPQKRATSPRTVGLIDRIFDTYHNLALEKQNKQLYQFVFNLGDYLISNETYPDYLNIVEDLSITDHANDFWLKSDSFYMTDSTHVMGELFLKKYTLEFIQKLDFSDEAQQKLKKLDSELFQGEIKKLESQNKLVRYFGSIDYRDIIDIKYLCLCSMEESLKTSEEQPQHDFFLQISLRAVNGVSLKKETTISEENEMMFNPCQSNSAIAQLYFKIQHKDEYGRIIPQNFQQEVIAQLKNKVNQMVALTKIDDSLPYKSRTFIPHYDAVDLDKNTKSRLCIIPVERYTMSLLTQYNLLQRAESVNKIQASECNNCNNCAVCYKMNNDVIQGYKKRQKNINKIIDKMKGSVTIPKKQQILKYAPEKSHNSELLNDLQISNLVGCLPSFYRGCDWKRIYKMNEDGCSLITFYTNCREYENTILVVQDEFGWVFGGFCTETWAPKYRFFGNGQNMLFSFQDSDEPYIYKFTGDGDQHQYSDEQSIGLGGSLERGRFGLFLGNNFSKGSSLKSELYNNEQLSKNSDFRVCSVEVWAIME